VLENLRKRLDHNMLNDIEGLGTPTLENLCLWMWAELQGELPHISAIEVFRDSLGQSCLYEGEAS
ncbi:MAG: 6-carboxytetrahydropterin synthase, partial [Pseudomonadota bacterium]|nr:6-carboxytetrahydropterin synthase [Pseudomonadota bacterium]